MSKNKRSLLICILDQCISAYVGIKYVSELCAMDTAAIALIYISDRYPSHMKIHHVEDALWVFILYKILNLISYI